MRRRVIGFVTLLALTTLSLDLLSRQTQRNVDWRYYSADNRATKYSPLDQINANNVTNLKVAWRHAQADPSLLSANPQLRLSNRYMSTPIMVGGVLYVTNGLGLVEAIDPGTGKTVFAIGGQSHPAELVALALP